MTAFNSLPYAADPQRAIAELSRVTRAAGRVLVTVGSGAEQSTCAHGIDSLAPDREVPEWDTFDMKDPERIRKSMEEVGFVVREQAKVSFTCTFAGVDEAVRAQLPAGPVEAAVRSSGREAVDRVLRGFFTPRAQPDGSVSMPVVFQYTLAERAA